MPPRERLFPQPAPRPSPVRSRQRLPSRARSAKGTTSRRCGKTPFRAGHDFQTLPKNSVSRRFWEGHEFHSCRNRRPINSGFQPLGECCPRNRSLLRGRVLSAPGSGFRLAPVPRRARLPDVAEKLRFAPGFGKGTSSTRAVTAAQSTAASSRWGNAAPRNRSLLRGRVLSAPGSGFRLAPVPRRARLPDVAEKLRFAPGFGKGTSSTRAVTAAQSTAASSRWGNAAPRNRSLLEDPRETRALSPEKVCHPEPTEGSAAHRSIPTSQRTNKSSQSRDENSECETSRSEHANYHPAARIPSSPTESSAHPENPSQSESTHPNE